jgi:thiosulfate/3-mercaptopyruvate sulfurtransferase
VNLTVQDKIAPSEFRRDLVRWQQLVSPTWLAALMAQAPVVAAPSGDWRLFEVGFDSPALFLAGHIAGAGYIHTDQLEQEPLWNKVSDQALLQLLLDNGIRQDTTVVLYGRNTLTAARAAHLMLYAGVRDVRLLDGGLAAWSGAGLALEQGLPIQYPVAGDFGGAFPAHPEYMIDMQQAKTLLRQPDGVLVSIRTWNEFVGKTSGYSYIQARGDIPGALWGRAGDEGNVNSVSEYHKPDGTMKSSREICGLWQDAGIHSGQQTAFYCGTGWRASVAFFYAWLMDWQRISVYDGGWCEWSRDAANPVVCRVNPVLSASQLSP